MGISPKITFFESYGRDLINSPFSFINPEIPVLALLAIALLFSIALSLVMLNSCLWPGVFPHHASLDIIAKKLAPRRTYSVLKSPYIDS